LYGRSSWLGRHSNRIFASHLGERLFLREGESFKTKAIAYHNDSPPMCIRYTYFPDCFLTQ
jgi:hypothetical protein